MLIMLLRYNVITLNNAHAYVIGVRAAEEGRGVVDHTAAATQPH